MPISSLQICLLDLVNLICVISHLTHLSCNNLCYLLICLFGICEVWAVIYVTCTTFEFLWVKPLEFEIELVIYYYIWRCQFCKKKKTRGFGIKNLTNSNWERTVRTTVGFYVGKWSNRPGPICLVVGSVPLFFETRPIRAHAYHMQSTSLKKFRPQNFTILNLEWLMA